MFRWVHVKFLFNRKFDLTAKSLVTNTGVIMCVLCNYLSLITFMLLTVFGLKLYSAKFMNNKILAFVTHLVSDCIGNRFLTRHAKFKIKYHRFDR